MGMRMGGKGSHELRLAWAVGLLVAVACLIRVGYLVARPELAITVVPDDAFYYLKLAQNRVLTGSWTFDGTSVTTGFHLLHAYLLVLLNLVFRPAAQDWLFMLGAVGAFASACLGVAAGLTWRAVQRIVGGRAAWWVLPVFVSLPVVQSATLLMEAHLVVLGAAVVLSVVSGRPQVTPLRVLGWVVAGFLAGLTRSDFALLPGLLWVLALLLRHRGPSRVAPSGLVLLGSGLAFCATLWHSYVVSGEFLQSSVRTKLRWSVESDASLAQVAGPAYIALFVLVLGYIALVVRRRGTPPLLAEPIAAACLLTVVGYSALYATVGQGVQEWYSASLVVPVAVTLAAAGGRLDARLARPLVAVLTIASLAFTVAQFNRQLWPWQAGMLHAAERLRDDDSIQHIGSWNAGILGVVSGRVVTNLDGLVDDGAAAAGARGDILGYLRQRGIEYLVDHADTVARPTSGQADGRLVACTEAVAVLGEAGDQEWSSGPVTLFRLRPGCD
jgi:hypothetical protein